jgi:hypothetical protein
MNKLNVASASARNKRIVVQRVNHTPSICALGLDAQSLNLLKRCPGRYWSNGQQSVGCHLFDLHAGMRKQRQQSPALVAGHRFKLGPHTLHRLVQSIISRGVDDISRTVLRDTNLSEFRNEILHAGIVRLDRHDYLRTRATIDDLLV